MIKTLYKPFRPWSLFGSVYIISDPHFMDYDMNWRIKDVPIFMNLPEDEESIAKTIAYHIVDETNKVCKKADTLIMLGDIGDVSFVSKIKAKYKVLIKGNHDKGNTIYEEYFDEVYSGALTISDKIILSHEPVRGPWLNIHGHQHHTEFDFGYKYENNYDADTKLYYKTFYLNVSSEINAFRPINLGELIKNGVLGYVDDIHRITIDKASKNKLSKNSLY